MASLARGPVSFVMINWLTAIFGFLALYALAALAYVWTRPGGHSPESAQWLSVIIVVCIVAAFVNEWRARRAQQRDRQDAPSPKS